MKPENIQIRFERNIFQETIQVALIRRPLDGKTQVAKLVWEDRAEAAPIEPTFEVTPEYIVDGLVVELLRLGFLKENETVDGLKGKLQATTVHLADMRSLVFKDSPGFSTEPATEALKGNML